ncbi:DUF4124 domain-containing protein [Undibacterium sp. RuRC25W]|uniref:DUF4124 domain-containing protein n=1 Tax=Undibacterium sp. RuRC25W TaxID=3413047 RepID=UPI003BF33709
MTTFYTLSNASAQVYQCEKNGNTQFTQTACSGDQKQIGPLKIKAATPTNEEQKAAIDRQKHAQAELKHLQQEREREREKQVKISAKQAEKIQHHKAACNQAQLRVNWAREDVANATLKTEARAKQRYNRAKEKAELICKSAP